MTKLLNLLPVMRSEPQWSGASVRHGSLGALVSTGPHAWAYAAAIGIPPVVNRMNEPHLRLSIKVETGRIGLSTLLDDTGTLVAEQVVSPSAGPVTVTVELPRHRAATLILRNSVEMSSRALVLEACLCDRAP